MSNKSQAPTEFTPKLFDVVIVGAGVAGLAAAIDMASSGLQVALLESQAFQSSKEGEHVRVSAINVVSERIIRNLACWESIAVEKISPFREISVSDAQGIEQVTFSHRDIGRAYLGHIVANEALINVMLERAGMLPSLKVLCPVQLKGFIIEGSVATVKLADGQILKTKLLVGADGARSWVREWLNIPLEEKSYEHMAVVATVKTECPHQYIARQKFRALGPIAFLPLQDAHTCSIVWSTSFEEAETLLKCGVAALNEKIASAIDHVLGEVTVVDKPVSFPLIMRHVTHYVHPRVALIGDAAHTIHPLAGQGMNLGILDAACLAQEVIAHFRAQRDIGLVQNLRRYERWRSSDNQLMIEAMAFFKEGFAVQTGFVSHLRDVTLHLTRRYRWLRRIFMHNAMGFRGELPKAASLEKYT